MRHIDKTETRTRRQEQWRARYGPWAVVTGSSSGIGREMALRLAEAGLNLILIARNRAALERSAADLTTRHGIDVRVVSADLAQKEALDTVEAATCNLEVGLLVAAAGFGTSGPFLDAALDQELEMLQVNCGALVGMSQHFGRRFARQRHGGMVLMSSIVAFQGTPYAAHYAATKAYVQTLAEGLQVELASFGVDVLACAPGPVHSGFAARAGMRMGTALRPVDVAQTTLDALGRKATVLPGLLSKLLTASLAPLPRHARVRIMGKVMSGMTRHRAQGSIPEASDWSHGTL